MGRISRYLARYVSETSNFSLFHILQAYLVMQENRKVESVLSFSW